MHFDELPENVKHDFKEADRAGKIRLLRSFNVPEDEIASRVGKSPEEIRRITGKNNRRDWWDKNKADIGTIASIVAAIAGIISLLHSLI